MKTAQANTKRQKTYHQAAYPAWINESPQQMQAYRDAMRKSDRRLEGLFLSLLAAAPALALLLLGIINTFTR
jgi:hypothetical protein